MRKITLLFASLFLCASAWAQTEGYAVTTTQLTSGELNGKTEATMIAIKNLSKTNNYYFVGNTGAAPYSKAEFDANGEAVFVWEPVTEGTPGSYYLKKLDGTYMQATSPKDFGDKATAAVFTTTNPTSTGSGSTNFNGDKDSQAYINGNDDANLVRFVTDSKWINVQNGDNGTPTYNTGQGGWTIHYVYTVEKRTICNVTYNFKYNGVVIYTQETEVALGTAYPAVTTQFPYGITAAAPEGTVEEDKTIDIELTITTPLPVEAATTVEGITTWYYVKMHTNPDYTKYIQALEDNKIEWADTEATAGDDSYLWGFVGDIWGMKMVNKGGKAIVSTSGDALLGDATNATSFVVTASATTQDGFCLQYADKSYLNGHDGFVKTWTANDAGSTLLLEKYDPEATGIETITTNAETVIYDLSGRRVEKMEKGIYIVNGKKIIK